MAERLAPRRIPVLPGTLLLGQPATSLRDGDQADSIRRSRKSCVEQRQVRLTRKISMRSKNSMRVAAGKRS